MPSRMAARDTLRSVKHGVQDPDEMEVYLVEKRLVFHTFSPMRPIRAFVCGRGATV
jgi:hypothetical protein